MNISETHSISLVPVRYIHTTIHCSLEGTKDTGTSCGPGKSNIQVCTEGSVLSLLTLLVELISINLSLPLVDGIKIELLENLVGKEMSALLALTETR